MALCVLQKSWQFREVYRNGKKIDGECAVVFYYHPGEGQSGTRFGFVASKRVGGAVRRSRAKRLLREAARQTAQRLRTGDLWIVVVARAGIFNASYQELHDELVTQFERAGLLRPERGT